MSDYDKEFWGDTKYINAHAFMEKYKGGSWDIEKIVEAFPGADVVEVVRCEDCVHCADDYVDTGFGAMPTFTCDLFETYGVSIRPGHYCSYGEKR